MDVESPSSMRSELAVLAILASFRVLAPPALAAGPGAEQAAGRGPLELSLKRAVELACSPEGNTRVQLSAEALKQAQARAAQARAALLPDLAAAATDQNLTRNLAAMGITLVAPPIPGFRFPTFVGPFSNM